MPLKTLRYTPPGKSVATEDTDRTPDTYNDLYAIGVILSDLVPVASRRRRRFCNVFPKC